MKKTGTVMRFGATLEVLHPDALYLRRLKAFGVQAIEKLKLTYLSFTHAKYPGHENAYTCVFFLKESHLVLTAYPEDRTLEFEVASCKTVGLTDLLHWLHAQEQLKIVSIFANDKDDEGRWLKGF